MQSLLVKIKDTFHLQQSSAITLLAFLNCTTLGAHVTEVPEEVYVLLKDVVEGFEVVVAATEDDDDAATEDDDDAAVNTPRINGRHLPNANPGQAERSHRHSQQFEEPEMHKAITGRSLVEDSVSPHITH